MLALRADDRTSPAAQTGSIPPSDVLVRVRNIYKHFRVKGGLFLRSRWLRAVDGVSLSVRRGETLGIVGESGCGKSTLARLMLNLIEPTSGDIVFRNANLADLDEREMREMRRRMQIVFQNPYSSLDPRMRIADIVSEPLRAHGIVTTAPEAERTAGELLSMVGIGSEALHRFPHEFSGGQRQRIGIARAIALRPDLVVCDEPLSALDVSIRSQVINLLCELKRELSLTYLFISHDLSVVRYISDRICVMYLGKIVETGRTEEIFENPLHPYTRSLIDAAPLANPHMRNRPRTILEGELPSAIDPPSGCRFRTRCAAAADICAAQEPPAPKGSKHSAACHFSEEAK
ncbi:ABC transporter ATP-binding protein [Synergistaceae bacterium OttesenSCG-928-I11]|nr:ABC transporter ATP-binding protein [Synergistaceae bacterium OttesenSCG-928-I11]